MEKRKSRFDGKRGIAAGFCAGISLVILVAVFTASEADAGCAGDCMTCHQNLADSPDHQALKTCVQCHEPASKKSFLPLTQSDGCGTRCFDCHNKWPADGWHAELDKCSKCHNADKDILTK